MCVCVYSTKSKFPSSICAAHIPYTLGCGVIHQSTRTTLLKKTWLISRKPWTVESSLFRGRESPCWNVDWPDAVQGLYNLPDILLYFFPFSPLPFLFHTVTFGWVGLWYSQFSHICFYGFCFPILFHRPTLWKFIYLAIYVYMNLTNTHYWAPLLCQVLSWC